VPKQIVYDLNSTTPSLRLSAAERRAGQAWLRVQGTGSARAPAKRQAVEMARSWPFYFARLFTARVPPGDSAVVAVSHAAVTIGVKGDVHIHTTQALSLKCSRNISNMSPGHPHLTKITKLREILQKRQVVSPSQSISGVSADNSLMIFYDIHGRKREVLILCSTI
jgi:hypothetical protein